VKGLYDLDVLTSTLDEVASVCSGPRYKMEACGFGERPEIPVSREGEERLRRCSSGRSVRRRRTAPCAALRGLSLATRLPFANSRMRSRQRYSDSVSGNA